MSAHISVLYAEDNPADTDLTRAHFARTAPDFTLEVAHDAASFLRRARERAHAILLLDQRLPDMDGVDVLRILMQEHNDTPVVMITGGGDTDLATQALRLGAHDYVPKRSGYLDQLPAKLRAAVELRRQSAGVAPHRAAPRRVLVIDDDPMAVALVVEHLARRAPHITVAKAHHPDQALAQLSTDASFDLLICDYMLPGMSGLELIAAVHRLGLTIPFILVTGMGNEDVVVAALKLGASDYLLKHGRHYAELALRIELAIDRHRLQLANERAATELAERQRALSALRESERQLHQLSRRLLDVQETERRHLARELHDEIGQVLTAAKLQLESAALHPEPQKATAQFREAVALLDRLLAQVRSLTLDLRPPLLDDLGLLPALNWLVERQQARAATPRVRLLADTAMSRCDSAIETACFRIAQEALTNALRHAAAQSITLTLDREDDALHLSVRDDGRGFDVDDAHHRAAQSGSLGLLGMHERLALAGGTFTLRSSPGHGTRVEAVFPLSPPPPAD